MAPGSPDASLYTNRTPYVLYYDGNAVREYPGAIDPRSVPPTDPNYIPSTARFFSINFYAPGAFGSGPNGSINASAVADVSILNKADELAHVIQTITSLTHSKDVIVVGHSLGGLVARAYLQRLATTPYGQDVAKLITLDTPHGGAAIANWPVEAYSGCNFENSVNRHELMPTSSFMDLLRRTSTGLPAGATLASIESFTNPGTIPGRPLPEQIPDDGVVAEVEQSFTQSIAGIPPPPSVFYDVSNQFSSVPSNCSLLAGTWPLHKLACLGTQPQTLDLVDAELEKAIHDSSTRTPTITSVTTASGPAAISQNTWIVIKGTRLTPTNTPAGGMFWSNAPEFASGRMPTQLGGVSVSVDGISAYVWWFCSAASSACPTDQINVLAPLDSSTGQAAVVVSNGGAPSAPFLIDKEALTPSFLLFDSTLHPVATHADYSLLGPATLYPGASTPAQPGESILLFGTGFGLPTVQITPGSATQSGPLPLLPGCVMDGNPQMPTAYAILISPGLYQFDFTVPLGMPPGDHRVDCTYFGAYMTPPVLIAVGPEIPTNLPLQSKSFDISGSFTITSAPAAIALNTPFSGTIHAQSGVLATMGKLDVSFWSPPTVSAGTSGTTVTFSGPFIGSNYGGTTIDSGALALTLVSLQTGSVVTGSFSFELRNGIIGAVVGTIQGTFSGTLGRIAID